MFALTHALATVGRELWAPEVLASHQTKSYASRLLTSAGDPAGGDVLVSAVCRVRDLNRRRRNHVQLCHSSKTLRTSGGGARQRVRYVLTKGANSSSCGLRPFVPKSASTGKLCPRALSDVHRDSTTWVVKIGRASCRERV